MKQLWKYKIQRKKNISLPGEGKQRQDGAPPKVPAPLEKDINLQGRDGLMPELQRCFSLQDYHFI